MSIRYNVYHVYCLIPARTTKNMKTQASETLYVRTMHVCKHAGVPVYRAGEEPISIILSGSSVTAVGIIASIFYLMSKVKRTLKSINGKRVKCYSLCVALRLKKQTWSLIHPERENKNRKHATSFHLNEFFEDLHVF